MPDSLWPHGLYSPQNSPGQNTGVGSHSLLQGDLPNPAFKPRSPEYQVDSLPTEPWGIPGISGKVGLGVQNEAGQRLTEFWQDQSSLVIANTLFQQHKRKPYIWISPDGQYQNQIHYILCSQRWKTSIESAKSRLGVDCGSDHELLIAKFRLKIEESRENQ